MGSPDQEQDAALDGAVDSASQDGAASAEHGRRSSSRANGLGITTVTITLLIILRIFSLAQWDWEVAGTILATIDLSDIPSVIVSTIYTEPLVTSIIVAAAGPLIVMFTIRDFRRHRRVSFGPLILIALLIAAGASLLITFRSWWMIVVALAVVAAGIAMLHPGAPPKVRRVGNAVVSRAIVACIVLELFVAAFSSTPWIERESIVLSSGEVVQGYVLEVESGFVKVLDEDRQVRVIISGDIASRSFI
ncbi:hypothetical protein CFK38_05225 [Brachybacterium vulturis]|uniref:Uncharacterized protein n=1 Tax=Brachybacterium vulturis TaxID=2017484 RepID=A0A291GLQ8_9MICO|nr:hypothetical protein [Brachybacterium vulturis]ATG51000.1 hypothetical protein CFK38_05225 [Brachybacterium vulturis]